MLRHRSPGALTGWTERGLFAASLLLLGWWATARLQAGSWQAHEGRRLEQAVRSGTPLRDTDGILGRIEIPRVGISAVIAPGVDDDTLSHAVGHIPGTALPGQTGNVGLAGHRDSYFRGLRELRRQDLIRVSTPEAIYEYAVNSMKVVKPDRAEVLDPSDGQTLTLVTCYPFSYVGRAPKRFVVTARRVEGALAQASGAGAGGDALPGASFEPSSGVDRVGSRSAITSPSASPDSTTTRPSAVGPSVTSTGANPVVARR